MKLKTLTLPTTLIEPNAERVDIADMQRAHKEMKVQFVKNLMNAEKATVELAKSKLEFEVEYLRRTIQ